MGIWFSTVWLALAVMYSRLHCQLSESLPLNGCGTFLIPAAHLQVQQVILRTHAHTDAHTLTLENDFSPALKVFSFFFFLPPRCCESKKASVCLFSPLSISEFSFWSFIHMIKSVHHPLCSLHISVYDEAIFDFGGQGSVSAVWQVYCRIGDIFSLDPLRIVWP